MDVERKIKFSVAIFSILLGAGTAFILVSFIMLILYGGAPTGFNLYFFLDYYDYKFLIIWIIASAIFVSLFYFQLRNDIKEKQDPSLIFVKCPECGTKALGYKYCRKCGKQLHD